MLKYLIDDTGVTHQADGDDMEIARQVLQILQVSYSVVLKIHGTPDDFFTRWTVIERTGNGTPAWICSEEADGTTEMLDNRGAA